MTNYSKKQRNLYNPNSNELFTISRSGIDLFLECPRCFYLDKRLGLRRPSLPGFSLNSAVDQLLKNEFDLLRENGEAHELMKKYSINAVPFKHSNINIWRNNFQGASYLHKETNLKISGAIDDVWIDNGTKELYIVDYKSTSTSKEISLDDEYKQNYKKQMEVYQWIFRKMGFNVAKTGYFIFANATKDRNKFDGKLEFEVSIVPYEGVDSWIEPTIFEIKKCLDSDKIPPSSEKCEYCKYRELISKEESLIRSNNLT